MKKMGKKIELFVKVSLLLCMLFVEIASPIKVFADEVIDSNYELSLVENEENKFVLSSSGSKILDELDTYIVKVVRNFKYVDGDYGEEKVEYYYFLGSELTHGVNLAKDEFIYNGISYVSVNVYEIVDKTIIDDLSAYGKEDYESLLLSNNVNMIMDTSFEEIIEDKVNGIGYTVYVNDLIVSDDLDNFDIEYLEKSEEVTSNNVSILYDINTGNLNPNKDYVGLIYVNDELFRVYNGDKFTLDYMYLIGGSYDVRLDIIDVFSKSVVMSKDIYFNYDATYSIEEYYSNVDNDYIEYPFISYTSLTDSEKEELGVEYSLFDNYLAFSIDNLLDEDSDIITNYNVIDNGNRYHEVFSKKFLGTFSLDNVTYSVLDLKKELLSKLSFDGISVYVTKGLEEVDDDSYLENGMQLHFDFYGNEVVYDLLVKGDVNGGIVDEDDISSLIDKLLNDDISFYDKFTLDLNDDALVNILDVSLLGYNIFKGEFVNSNRDLTDNIVATIEKDDKLLRVGDSFDVILKLDGFENDFINAITGMIDYNSEAFRLDNVTILNEEFVGNYTSDKFMYASVYTYGENDKEFIRLSFTALEEGTFELSLKGIELVFDGESFDDISSNELEIDVYRKLHTDSSLGSLSSNYGRFDKEFNSSVLEYTLYVDSYVNEVTINGSANDMYATTLGFGTYSLNYDKTLITIEVCAEDGTNTIYKVNVVKVYKSSNNNLSNIIIDGYDIDFSYDVLEYDITVDSSVNELDISALVEDYRSWAKIEGNENFKTGKNVVTIKVYAEDGSTKTYTINVTKKEEVKDTTSDEIIKDDDSSTGSEKTIIIILIVLIVIGLLYLIFKKDEESEEIIIKEVKKEDKDKKSKK